MPISIRIPTPFRRLTRGKGEITSEGKTIQELFENLEAEYPGFKDSILDEKGNILSYANIFVNGNDIRAVKSLGTDLKDGDVVSIIFAIAGG